MSYIDQLPPALRPNAGPWDCDAQSTMYSIDDDELTMIEVRANVTEAGWNTVAFIEAMWPGADINARLIAAAPDLLEAIPPLISLVHRLLPKHAQSDSTLDNLAEVIQARAALAKALLPHVNQLERN